MGDAVMKDKGRGVGRACGGGGRGLNSGSRRL